MRRFFAELNETTVGKLVEISADQAKHIRNSLRLPEGTEIILFDGKLVASAKLVKITSSQVTAEITELAYPTPPYFEKTFSLYCGLPHQPQRADLIVEKATELGVSNFSWLNSEYAQIDLRQLDKRYERWKRLSIEATKQCERQDFLNIREGIELKEVTGLDGTTLIFTSEKPTTTSYLPELAGQLKSEGEINIVIGPEGGFSEKELQICAASAAKLVTLPYPILRTETAVIAACAAVILLAT